ncbi:hypothetical protein K493DRAFT_33452 [Basidiobolus meristosporus CBS 931.73]|uniref:C3H1-type domain-containing protein n=1 Tax=Basidiobolus meristosporus CBS 931.73 TaxID=1314790 RepID=A0A1Y1Z680_9FUNG|nr:hypothetical protein K493DRAFT_33452 [Basidiobolus meristosporus CBS 931.73]|eukprot:ORY05761.1 hypothetical protein K493DRAFT_33452 [Basidiobolus meristosporus CBS 931.73]
MSDTLSNIKPEEIQDKIMYKLAEFGYGAEDDPMLAEFVAVMVANKKSLEQVNSEMTDLIGADYNPAFGDWLMQLTTPTTDTTNQENTKAEENTSADSMAVDDNSASTMTTTRQQDVAPQRTRLLMNALSNVNKTETESKREKRRNDDMDVEEQPENNGQKQRRTNQGRERPVRGKRGKLNHGDRDRTHKKTTETVFTISLEPKKSGKSSDISPEGLKDQPQRCTFWPNCTKGEDCKFFHPTKPCRDYPNCPNGAKCLYIHLDDEKAETKKAVACKFGAKCTNPECKFSHPSPAAIAAGAKSEKAERCRYYPNCKNAHCTYSHVDEPQPNYGESLAPESAPVPNPSYVRKVPVQCRDGSNCTRPGCHFLHPGETAPEQPTNKVPIQCRDGAECKRPGCHFLHPGEEMTPNAIPCRFGVYCKRPDCKFSHPHRQAGGNHISERPFSVANDNVVEKIPVMNGNLTGGTSVGINDTPNPVANDDENVDVIMEL